MPIVIHETDEFTRWISELKDRRARALVLVRIQRLASGNPGDVKALGAGVSELRIPYGPGYRLYFTRRGAEIILLLCGGDKGTQSADIRKAKALAAALKES
jgi:putative addiction module killer protein